MRRSSPTLTVALFLTALPAAAADLHVVVAKDGSGDFPTVQSAVDHVMDRVLAPFSGRVIIDIRPGIYQERVRIPPDRPRITLRGQDAASTVIRSSVGAKDVGGTFFSAVVDISGAEFEAENLTFENAFGAGTQAVAASVHSDRAVFRRCRFLGMQDTLYAASGRQYYEDCYIAGGVDFIFGNAQAVFERCDIHSLAGGYIAAVSRTLPNGPEGFVFDHCDLTAAPGVPDVALGRPWRHYARVVFLDTSMGPHIRPEGWNNWNKPDAEKTSYFAEFNSTGPGAAPGRRVAWSHALTAAEAARFRPDVFLRGADNWKPAGPPPAAPEPPRTAAAPPPAASPKAAPQAAAFPENLPASGTDLGRIFGIAVDPAGNLLLSLHDYHMVVRLDAQTKRLRRIAGSGEEGFTGDGGPALRASLSFPAGISLDSAGNLFIADSLNHRVRKVDRAGVITTVAGTGACGFSGDNGPAAQAALCYPQSVAPDAEGSLYISDQNGGGQSARIRRIDRAGILSTFAGGGASACGECRAAELALSTVMAIAFDRRGGLLIPDLLNARLLLVDSARYARTIAGGLGPGHSGDGGLAIVAQLAGPESVAADAAGNVYVAGNGRLRKIAPTGVISNVAAAALPLVSTGMRVAVDSANGLYVAALDRVYRVSPRGEISLVAGKPPGR